jgi:WD40 repeat protein
MKKILFLILPAFVLLFQAASAGIILDSLWEKQLDTTEVNQVKFSPDGNYIAVAQQHYHDIEDTIHTNPILLNARNGQFVREFTGGHRATMIKEVAFSPDGSLLASGDYPFDSLVTVCIWNVQSGQLVRKLLWKDSVAMHHTNVQFLEFTKDGKYLVCLLNSKIQYYDDVDHKLKYYDNLLLVIDTQTWQVVRKSIMHPRSVKLSPNSIWYTYYDSELLMNNTYLYHVRIRSLFNDSLVADFTHTGYPYLLAFSPDSSKLAEILEDSIRIYNLNTMSILRDIPSIPSTYYEMKFIPNTQYLALSSNYAPIDSLLAIVDINTGQIVAHDNFAGHFDIDNSATHIINGISSRIRLDSIAYTSTAVHDDNPAGKINVIYPNPTDGSINIQVNEGNTSDLKIEIFDSNGNIVSRPKQDFQTDKENIIHYNTQNLGSGVYYLRLSGGESSKTYKFIISR